MDTKPQLPKVTSLRPRIIVVGVGGAGSNAVNNMIASGLDGVTFVVANTDSQSLANSTADHRIQLGEKLTDGLGAGARPEVGKAAAEETLESIRTELAGAHMVFVAAGMGGGTGTGAAAVIARIARECGALTVGVVTKPFHFEGTRRMRAAEAGIAALKPEVDTLLVIPNQNLFRIANERTTFAEAFVMADQVLYSGIACVVDLIVKEGLINLDFADVRTIMSGMGTAMMGTGEASGDKRAVLAAEEAISNPLLDDISLRGARGLLVSITGSRDLKLYEVDEAATRVRQEVDSEANIIVGATFDDTLGDRIRVSIVASGMERLGENALAWDARGQQAAAHLQPPFIEPYPDPSVLPEAEAPPEPTQFQHPPPQDFARTLSEALEPRYDGQQNQPQHPPSSAGGWSSQSGAVFEDAPPQVAGGASDGAPGHFQDVHRPPAQQDDGFFPQAPADTRRSGRRLPDVQDFPAVGQRDYHAKIGQYSDRTHPPASLRPSPPLPRQQAKPGFFARLFGGRRKAKSTSEQASNAQAGSLRVAKRQNEPVAPRSRGSASHAGTARRDDEAYELPVFFGDERK